MQSAVRHAAGRGGVARFRRAECAAAGWCMMSKRSKYEIELDQQLELGGLLEGSEAEYQFDADRNWRFDRAWPPQRIACEVDGGNHMARINPRTGQAFAVGRHTQSDDYRKRNAAVAAGWRVFAFTPEMIRSGEAFGALQDALVALPFTG